MARFFSFTGEIGEGFQLHDTEVDAREKVEEFVAVATSANVPAEEIEEMCFGRLLGKVEEVEEMCFGRLLGKVEEVDHHEFEIVEEE